MRRIALALGLAVSLFACERNEQQPSTKPTADAAVRVIASSESAPSLRVSAAPFDSEAPRAAPPRPTVDASIALSDLAWKSYRGDRFSVLFPGEPKLKELPVDDGKVGYTEASFDVPGGQVSLAAGFTDHTPDD